MNFHWRPLFPGERDPEKLWGGVLTATALLAAAWLSSGLPTPLCPLHSITGIPCPTCGITRGLRFLMHGNYTAAFSFNPLLMAALAGAALWLLYAVIVVVCGLPRLRCSPLSAPVATALKIGAVILIAANWVYLILRERSLAGL